MATIHNVLLNNRVGPRLSQLFEIWIEHIGSLAGAIPVIPHERIWSISIPDCDGIVFTTHATSSGSSDALAFSAALGAQGDDGSALHLLRRPLSPIDNGQHRQIHCEGRTIRNEPIRRLVDLQDCGNVASGLPACCQVLGRKICPLTAWEIEL